MKQTLGLPSEWRQTAVMLALIALVFRALLPVGFMPEFSGHGHATMVICSGDQQKTISVDRSGDESGSHKSHQGDICAFSVNISAADVPQFILALLPVSGNSFQEIFVFHATPVAAHTYASRAPPLA